MCKIIDGVVISLVRMRCSYAVVPLAVIVNGQETVRESKGETQRRRSVTDDQTVTGP